MNVLEKLAFTYAVAAGGIVVYAVALFLLWAFTAYEGTGFPQVDVFGW